MSRGHVALAERVEKGAGFVHGDDGGTAERPQCRRQLQDLLLLPVERAAARQKEDRRSDGGRRRAACGIVRYHRGWRGHVRRDGVFSDQVWRLNEAVRRPEPTAFQAGMQAAPVSSGAKSPVESNKARSEVPPVP